MSYYNMGAVSLSANASSITLSQIESNPDIKVLFLELRLRSNRANVYSNIGIRFNGDSGNNYGYLERGATKVVSGGALDTINGSAVNSTSYAMVMSIPGANGVANTFSTTYINIYGYNNSLHFTSVVGSGGHDQNSSGGYYSDFTGVWRSTSTVNSITAVNTDGNLVTGSSLSLYGWGV